MARMQMVSLLFVAAIMSCTFLLMKYQDFKHEKEQEQHKNTVPVQQIPDYEYDEPDAESLAIIDLHPEEVGKVIPIEHILQVLEFCLRTCPTPNGRFALPGNCSELYIECQNNEMFIQRCSAGLHLNPETQNCD